MKNHPYAVRTMPAREATFQPRPLNRRKATQWSVEFLVESEFMLTSHVMYENVTTKRRIYLNRISDEEFDMLQAFDVEFVNQHVFLKDWVGISYWYINDNKTGKLSRVWVDVCNPFDHPSQKIWVGK